MRKVFLRLFLLVLLVLAIPFLVPESGRIPVQGAGPRDWNRQSFWYEPWGASGVHKGIDIFAPAGQPVLSAVSGVVIYEGEMGRGGKVVGVLGPRWRVHYYAHLRDSSVHHLEWLHGGEPIGSVGNTGNAAGKPPHLHYAVISLLPLPWRATTQTQGWRRMFFIDPNEVVLKSL